MKISKFVGICFILFFLTLGISTASDLNDSNALLQSDYGSFNELQNLIDESLENSTVNLTKDYFSDNNDFPDGITINKALTINGNNHVIDADFNSRIFIIYSSGVVLNNIKFINGKSSSEGGAVRFEAGGEINNCEFVNNAAGSGGAVYIDNYGQLNFAKINNSTFVNNSANDVGGAIHQFDNCNVYNSNFVNNHAPSAGAIYQFNNCSVFNSNFIKNSATSSNGGYGGAIYQYGSNVYGSYFVNNFAFWNGGAIYQQDSSNVYNSNFVNNSANDCGGAIYQVDSNVYNSKFVNNSASHGGAIFQEVFQKNDCIVQNCTFENNHADYGCDDICNSYNCTKNNESDNITPIESDSNQNKINNIEDKNSTGNPLALLVLSLFAILIRIKN